MNPPTSRRAAAVGASLALLLGACTGDSAPEVDDLAASPTIAATDEGESPAPSPEPTATSSPSDSPEPSPSPCPAGQQRVVPGGDCFAPSSPEPEPEAEPEPEPTQTATTEPDPEPEPGPCDREAQSFTITGTNFAFDPGDLGEVCVGDTIILDVEEGTHTLKDQETGRETAAIGPDGAPVALEVTVTGTYDFFCGIHPQPMRTDVNVAG